MALVHVNLLKSKRVILCTCAACCLVRGGKELSGDEDEDETEVIAEVYTVRCYKVTDEDDTEASGDTDER